MAFEMAQSVLILAHLYSNIESNGTNPQQQEMLTTSKGSLKCKTAANSV